jgi:hypothetical protein
MIKRKVEGKVLNLEEHNNAMSEENFEKFSATLNFERLFDEAPDEAVTKKLLSRRFFD